MALRITLGLIVAIATGAAAAGDPATLSPEIEAAVTAGRFEQAEELLRRRLTDPNAPVTEPAAVQLEIIRRLRREYSITPEQMLTKIQRRIPDATPADLERWRGRNELEGRLIDGQLRYFRREPGNLLRFSPEARARCLGPVPSGGFDFPLTEHLAELVRIAESSPDPAIYPVRHRVRYSLSVNAGHPRLKPGAVVRCWLPYPQEYRQQGSVRLIKAAPQPRHISPAGTPQRTMYFEQTLADPPVAPQFSAEFEFTTRAYVPKLDAGAVKPYDTSNNTFRTFTAERPPHIVFSPEVRRIVRDVAAGEPNPLLRARRLFRWTCESMSYCAEREYGTIANISGKGLTTRRGDCGVQALVFITLCRAAGIPARWQSGWEMIPGHRNMHDWAEFYVEPWGWLPADPSTPSYGLRRHDDARVRDFFCGSLDAYRMIVNHDIARELDPPKTSLRSEPNDFQRGEIEIDGHNLYFDEWDWTFEVESSPPAAD